MPDLCTGCPYKEKCIEKYGPEREDGDDYRAVEGTHFCRRSWDSFIEIMEEKHGVSTEKA